MGCLKRAVPLPRPDSFTESGRFVSDVRICAIAYRSRERAVKDVEVSAGVA